MLVSFGGVEKIGYGGEIAASVPAGKFLFANPFRSRKRRGALAKGALEPRRTN